MPRHPISPSARDQTKKDLEQLEALIEEHDAVYLLMDSRESRWLPTVIGAARGKVSARSMYAPWTRGATILTSTRTATAGDERCAGVRYLPRHAAWAALVVGEEDRFRASQAWVDLSGPTRLLLLQRCRRADGCESLQVS